MQKRKLTYIYRVMRPDSYGLWAVVVLRANPLLPAQQLCTHKTRQAARLCCWNRQEGARVAKRKGCSGVE